MIGPGGAVGGCVDQWQRAPSPRGGKSQARNGDAEARQRNSCFTRRSRQTILMMINQLLACINEWRGQNSENGSRAMSGKDKFDSHVL